MASLTHLNINSMLIILTVTTNQQVDYKSENKQWTRIAVKICLLLLDTSGFSRCRCIAKRLKGLLPVLHRIVRTVSH